MQKLPIKEALLLKDNLSTMCILYKGFLITRFHAIPVYKECHGPVAHLYLLFLASVDSLVRKQLLTHDLILDALRNVGHQPSQETGNHKDEMLHGRTQGGGRIVSAPISLTLAPISLVPTTFFCRHIFV